MLVNIEDPTVKILFVDDSRYGEEKDYLRLLKASFPVAQITMLSPEDFQRVEGIITENQYAVIMLDQSLTNWIPHPVFGECGQNLIPFIKKNSPNSIIVGISGDEKGNKILFKAGADLTLPKNLFCSQTNNMISSDLQLVPKD